MNVKVTADSTCDLPSEIVAKYGIEIVPLYIMMDDKAYRDTIDITRPDVFAYFEKTGKLTQTAAVNTEDYREVFARNLKDHDGLVHFTISSEMSSCYHNACEAAKKFKNVYVVDSRNLSSGIGQLVIDAAELARDGKSANEIFKAAEERKELLDVSFILDTLTYLAKGGRCSSLLALSAGLLQIKPCIEVVNGTMGVGKKYRGKMVQVLQSYVRDRLEGRDDIDYGRIFITDSGFSQDVIDAVTETVKECGPFKQILYSQSGCTISNHCGPNCLGILYFHTAK